MIVTQQDIDNAILLANSTLNKLAIRDAENMRMGIGGCIDDVQKVEGLIASIWFLENQSSLINQECIDNTDVWTQIEFIKSNSIVC